MSALVVLFEILEPAVIEPIVGLTAERWDLAFIFMQILVFGIGTLVGLEL